MNTYEVQWGCGGYEAKGLTFVAALEKAKLVIARGRGRCPVYIVNIDNVDLGCEDGLTEEEREDAELVLERDWSECQTCGKTFVAGDGDGSGEACIDCIEIANARKEPDWDALIDQRRGK